ncbi:MAG TPA: chitinase [Pseudonocardiaceae bacterium]
MAGHLRRSLVASAIALLPAALVIGSTTTAAAAQAAPAAFPTHFSAPYLQISSGDAGDMAADMKASGDKYYTLAFLTSNGGCNLQWEDGGDSVGAFKSQISSLQAAGGNVAASFGGAGSTELAESCTSVSSLAAAYEKVVSTYSIYRLDFDIEGNTINNTAATSRRNQALAMVEAWNKSVQVDYTLPVDPTGLESNAQNVLKDAKSKGVAVSVVNIMTMDFGNGQNALNDAESGAKATHGQLESIFGSSSAAAWGQLGLTPIAGKNDDNENFTQSNAKTLESFAASNGVHELAFWEVDQYDKKVGYAYSKIFNAITG